jgi:hypothetical protein
VVGGGLGAGAGASPEAALTMPPEDAAQLIVAAIQARKPRLVITRMAKAADWLARLTPTRYWAICQRVARRKVP